MATLRAVVQLVKNRGKIKQGGSTITQQVVKNTYLSSERTYTRTIVEMILAQELEKRYTKADIMEIYCNTNFYGNNCYGVEAASQFYFDKAAKDLTVEEAATLAGISNAPSRYEPVRHPDLALKKRNQVLKSMETVGYLTEEDYEAAVASHFRKQSKGNRRRLLKFVCTLCGNTSYDGSESISFYLSFFH